MTETPTSLQRVSASESWLAKNAGIQVDHGPSGIVVSLPPDLSRACHPLTPTSHIVQVDPNYRPMLKLVHLNEEEHTYNEKGKRALTAKALNLLCDAAGIQFLDPSVDYMGGAGVAFTASAKRRGPDGTWDVRHASKAVRFNWLERKTRREAQATAKKNGGQPLDEEELVKRVDDALEHIDAKTETKAMSRVIRHWLAVKSTYAKGEVGAKPFLTLSWVLTPDYDSPHVRQIIEANFSGARSALYESPPARRQLPEVPDDEPEPEPEPDEPLVLEGTVVPPADLEEPGASDDYDPDFDPGLAEPAGPPRPDVPVTFSQGPYSGMPVDAVLEDPEGRAWVAELVAKARPSDRRTRLLTWLSWAERRDLGPGDCAQLARDLRATGDQFAG